MTIEIPDVKKSWTNPIHTVTIGATANEGGTRTSTVTVGGETTLPFYHFEGEMPNAPVILYATISSRMYQAARWRTGKLYPTH